MFKKTEKIKLEEGIEIDFIKPGFQQIGYIFKFYTEAFKDQLLTKTEQNKLTDQQIMDKCIKSMESISNVEEVIGISLTNPVSISYIQKCIKECFPNLIDIEILEDRIFFELITILLNSLSEINIK